MCKKVFSFDFAQQIHLPYDSQQVDPIFFLTGYKNWIVWSGNGINWKIHSLHNPRSLCNRAGVKCCPVFTTDYFKNFTLRDTVCMSCCGQNKAYKEDPKIRNAHTEEELSSLVETLSLTVA